MENETATYTLTHFWGDMLGASHDVTLGQGLTLGEVAAALRASSSGEDPTQYMLTELPTGALEATFNGLTKTIAYRD